MPLTKFICPGGTPSTGRQNTFDHCVNKCTYRCLPRILLHKMTKRLKTDIIERPQITVTSLVAPRASYLQNKHEYCLEPRDLYDITRGHFRHAALECEDGELEGWSSEKRYYKKIKIDGDEIEISGQIDGINREGGITEIVDFKTTSDNSVFFLRDLKEDYVRQVNLYRYLLGEPVHKLTIVTLTMADCIVSGQPFTIERFETREPCKTGHKNLISKECVKSYSKSPTSSSGVWRTTFKCPAIPFMTDADIEAYIFPRAKALSDAYSKGIVPLVSYCPEWKCEKYCNVKDICRKLASEGK